ncbi:MAG: hypothetical protein QXO27_03375 [Candidatus Aenigmatarchaeota archaeon]
MKNDKRKSNWIGILIIVILIGGVLWIWRNQTQPIINEKYCENDTDCVGTCMKCVNIYNAPKEEPPCYIRPVCECIDNECVKKEETCINKCGDGICQEIVCMTIGCPCAETKANCPQDCK